MKALLLSLAILTVPALSATHKGANIDDHDFRCRGVIYQKQFHYNVPQPDKEYRFGYDDTKQATCRFHDAFVKITTDPENKLGAFLTDTAIDDDRFYAYTNRVVTWYPEFPNAGEWLTRGSYKIYVYFDEEGGQPSNFNQ